MTDAELDDLIRVSPTLFHMAERGAWPAIQEYGLLSSSALLDLYGVTGVPRETLEACRRATMTRLTRPGLPGATLRDQKPMSDAALARCLTDGMAPSAWYRLLNGKVFFWLSQSRLAKLLNAAPYRSQEHDIIELDTAALIAAYRLAITLSPINSGSTIRNPVPRGPHTFQSIGSYDYAHWRRRRPSGDRVVELAITSAVPDIGRFVKTVTTRSA